ncbi:MAG TPA: hypothetical protein VG502_07590 [Flexivirga sp.]|uniref:hypothetical protein n=1 Tax=Flexivirga sp. TaxID=1962927 RepID=UPI002C26FC0F|nr:hypothetical protein [Flexivirga sp.]HWC22146.1 hypothetical protein [Flexivirga sp.]
MTLHLAPDFSGARWIADELRRQDWWRLVTRGPLCFEAYARLRFIPDPTYPGMSENDFEAPEDLPDEQESLQRVLAALTGHTATPDDLFFAIWEGWPSGVSQLDVPKWSLPNRQFVLLRGASADFRTWRAPQWPNAYGDELPTPAYVWPADHAWCVTEDVDPHFATIAGGAAAIDAVLGIDGLDIVRDDPYVEPPFYF